MKRRVLLIAAVLTALLAGGLWVRYRHAKVVQERLESRVAAGAASFDFAASTPFEWERMYVFGPYTPRETVEKALGFAWPDFRHTSIRSSKGDCLVVFVKDGRVVYWYEQPRTIELGWLANEKGYDRAEAVFIVDRTDPARPALRVAQPMTTTRPVPATAPAAGKPGSG
jgi:hypothetical protein